MEEERVKNIRLLNMTLNQYRNAVDDVLNDFWPRVLTRQEAHFNKYGRYWQGGWTSLTIPNTVTLDIVLPTIVTLLSNVPGSEVGTWADIENFPLLLAFRVKIDNYAGPQGKGFVGVIQGSFNGTLYERSKNEGPETYRTEAWHALG